MPNNNLTDAEIIKALECRVKGKCPECPYFHSYPCDKCKKLDEDALDLIYRQQEEKETLINGQETLQKYIAEQKTEIERLNKENKDYVYLYNKHINTAFNYIKAEAYRECIEKIKQRAECCSCSNAVNTIADNVLKDLVGEDK